MVLGHALRRRSCQQSTGLAVGESVAGSGAGAAPFFRIFNPVLQGEKFDPDGAYVRRWVPELAILPAPHIHSPWRVPGEALAQAGIAFGRTYPLQIVDHGLARAGALAAFAEISGATSDD